MSKKLKEGEALKQLAVAYSLVQSALVTGQVPDFSLFKEAEKLAQEAQAMVDRVNCVGCGLLLEVNKSHYSRLFLNQHNICTNKGEVTQALTSEQRELVLCEACAKPITTFLSKEG